MDKYLNNLELFYDEKVKFLSQKDKYISCSQCKKGKKEFKESYEEIILSCGGDGECGDQIKIRFPKYVHYETVVRDLKEELNKDLNWKSIQNFLDVSDQLEESETKKGKINEQIQTIEELFYEKNMKMKEKLLQKFYDDRIKKTKKCIEITKKLKEKSDNNLRKEYVVLVQELNKEYEEIQEIINDVNPFLMTDEPEVTIKHDNYEMKKVEKERKVEEEGEEVNEGKLIEKILNHMIQNNGIMKREEYNQIKGEDYKTEWGSTLFYNLQVNKSKHPWKKKEQEKYGPIIIDPESSNPDEIKFTEKWMEFKNINSFKIGMKVSWMKGDIKKTGTIKELKAKGAVIEEDETGKKQRKSFKQLTIED